MTRISSHAAAAMTVTVTEAVTINSKDYGSTQTFSIASVANVNRRLVTVPTSNPTILSFSTASAAGTYIPGKVKYMRFTNLDATNHISLTFINEYDDEFVVKLDKGMTFMLVGDVDGGMANMIDAGSQSLSFSDATCDYNNDPTITCDSSSAIHPGLAVSGTGIPAGAYVSSVNTAGAVTSFELSASTTDGAVTNGTLTFSPYLGDLKSISADADTGVCDLEVFVAEIA